MATATKSTARTSRPKTAPKARKAAPKATPKAATAQPVEIRTKATSKAQVRMYDEPRKALFAYLGAGDVVLENAKLISARVTGMSAKVTSSVRQPREVQGRLTTGFVKLYEDLAARGEKVADRMGSSDYAKRALEQTKFARSQVREVVTTARKAVDDATETAREALKKVS